MSDEWHEGTMVLSQEQFQKLLNGTKAEPAPKRPEPPFLIVEDIQERFPRLKVTRKLGEGGVATVWHVVDEWERELALKILKPGIEEDARYMERFRMETDALHMVWHPHLIQCDPKPPQHENAPWALFEYIEGGTLRQALRRGAYSRRIALQTARDIASALAMVHRTGMVHRDIKPENILLRGDGAPVLADFGHLAKLRPTTREATLTNTNDAIGTAGYMAPEQREGPARAVTIDVYQMGVLLREMLSGELPGPEGYQDAPNTGDAGIDRLITQMCADEPADRVQTMDEVIERLDALLG